MKNLNNALKRFSSKERREIEHLVKRIMARELTGLDCKKLKGASNLFRVRKGKARIVFELRNNEDPAIFSIGRRKEDTYKF